MKAKINNRWAINLPTNRALFHDTIPNWESQRLDSIYRNTKKGDTILYIGAECGDMPALFTLWGAKVVCVEPQPKYWPIIKRHFDMNKVKPLACFAGFASNVSEPTPPLADFNIGNKGLWPKCAYDELEEWDGFRNVIETGVSTPQLPVDEIMTEYKIKHADIMTIDVEGAEFEVLKGAVNTLIDDRPLVYVSIHPEMLARDWGVTRENVIDYMIDLNYEPILLFTDHEEHWVFYPDGKELK